MKDEMMDMLRSMADIDIASTPAFRLVIALRSNLITLGWDHTTASTVVSKMPIQVSSTDWNTELDEIAELFATMLDSMRNALRREISEDSDVDTMIIESASNMDLTLP
jgi:hypothetical protein